MGKVTEHLIKIITKQVKDKGVVVWYDPDKAYPEIAEELTIPDTVVLHFKDSFFRLRKEIDPYLCGPHKKHDNGSHRKPFLCAQNLLKPLSNECLS